MMRLSLMFLLLASALPFTAACFPVFAQDVNDTIESLHDQALQGNVSAMYFLGMKYDEGWDVPQDDTKAAVWYEKAASNGDINAQFEVGIIYSEGTGVSQDDTKADYWYEKFAESYEKAAKEKREGLHSAAFESYFLDLGARYASGLGVEQDFEKAKKWYGRAAEKGNAEAQFNLGALYLTGSGLKQRNFQKAREWFEKSALQGDAGGMAMLAVIYGDGIGVPKNYLIAYKWANIASGLGHEKSSLIRDDLERRMTPEQIAEGQKLASDWKPNQHH